MATNVVVEKPHRRHGGSTPGRRCIDWGANTHLEVLKMLAWAVSGGPYFPLWNRVNEVCERVFEHVTGEKGVTFNLICRETFETQGLRITENKLVQRADKTERYQEFNGWERKVLDAVTKIEEEDEEHHLHLEHPEEKS